MSFMDKAKDALGDAKAKAEELAAEHGDKADGAIDKATTFIQSKTPDNLDDKVKTAADKAKGLVDDLETEGKKDASNRDTGTK